MEKFSLDALLKLRRHDRDRRSAELAAARRADDELRQQTLQTAARQQQALEQRRRASAPGPLDVALLMQQHDYEAALRGNAQRLRLRREEQQVEIQRRREALTETDRAAKTLEILREKHLLRLRREQLRQENRDIY